jgi:transposase
MLSYPLIKEGLSSHELRSLAREQKDGPTRLRFVAIALIREGETCVEVARVLGMSRESIRLWLKRYRQEGPEGLKTRRSPGRRPHLDEDQLMELRRMIEKESPSGQVNWTLKSLCRAIETSFGKSYSIGGLGQLLNRLGYRKLTVRPRHAKADPDAQEAFKKNA